MIFRHAQIVSPEGLLCDYDLQTVADHIHAIEPSGNQRLSPAPGETVLDLNGQVIVPAFYNLHCHLPMTLLRGWGENLPLQRWLEEKIFPFEELLTPDDMYWGSLLGIAELLRSGCCAFSDMYMGEAGIIRAVQDSGIKANLGRGTGFLDNSVSFSETLGGQEALMLLEAAHADPSGRLKTDATIHAEYTMTEKGARAVLAFAQEHNLAVQVHISETRKEHEECQARHNGLTPLALFDRLGFFDRPLILAHCVWLEDSDYRLLAERIAAGADVTLVHNPSSNLKLGSGLADLKRWEASGVRICIGTDGAASNNNLNMLEEATLASLLQKGLHHDPVYLGPDKLLNLLTQNGAAAQHRDHAGSLAIGSKADLFIFDPQAAPATQPCYDPLANLFYAAEASQIRLTMVDGEVLWQDGKPTRFDLDEVYREVRRIAQEKSSALRR